MNPVEVIAHYAAERLQLLIQVEKLKKKVEELEKQQSDD